MEFQWTWKVEERGGQAMFAAIYRDFQQCPISCSPSFTKAPPFKLPLPMALSTKMPL